MQKKPDNLSLDAMEARKAGMSYGKWKGLKSPVKIAENEIPEGLKVCAYCRNIFKPSANGRQKYCQLSCADKARAERDRLNGRSHHKDCT